MAPFFASSRAFAVRGSGVVGGENGGPEIFCRSAASPGSTLNAHRDDAFDCSRKYSFINDCGISVPFGISPLYSTNTVCQGVPS